MIDAFVAQNFVPKNPKFLKFFCQNLRSVLLKMLIKFPFFASKWGVFFEIFVVVLGVMFGKSIKKLVQRPQEVKRKTR